MTPTPPPGSSPVASVPLPAVPLTIGPATPAPSPRPARRLAGLRLAAVIPAYQAARSIGAVVERTRAQVTDVWVVDDGSTEGTAAAARAAGARVLVHSVNRGKGRALRTAFETLLDAGFDGFVTLDADGQHLPEEIPALVAGAVASGADLVLGTREHHFVEMGRVRRASNRMSSRLISVAAGARLADVQTGFRLYRRRLLERVPLLESGFDAESAVVVRALRRGFSVMAVPVRLGYADGRATSHYRPVRDSLRIARAVLGARLEGAG